VQNKSRHSFVERISGAAQFDVEIYHEVSSDITATWSALTVIMGTSLVSSLVLFVQNPSLGLEFLIGSVIASVVAFAVWFWIILFVGTKLSRGPNPSGYYAQPTWGGLLRSLGFSRSPDLLGFSALLPVVGPLLIFGVNIWTIATMAIAVREEFNYRSTWKSVGVVVVGFIPSTFIFGLILIQFADPAMLDALVTVD
jgi:hypothetical protein|tara:strand:- start:283 stop:873 length:591 start_codon:yes stop_codon:yes gene_type:complete